MNTRELLETMLGSIEKGWVQGTLYDEITFDSGETIVGAVCLEGACNLTWDWANNNHATADWLTTWKLPAGHALAEVIRDLFPGRTGNYVADWRIAVAFNDHEDTTKEDVILVLKHAIRACD